MLIKNDRHISDVHSIRTNSESDVKSLGSPIRGSSNADQEVMNHKLRLLGQDFDPSQYLFLLPRTFNLMEPGEWVGE